MNSKQQRLAVQRRCEVIHKHKKEIFRQMDILSKERNVEWTKSFMIGWNCKTSLMVFYFKDLGKWTDFLYQQQEKAKQGNNEYEDVMSIQLWELYQK